MMRVTRVGGLLLLLCACGTSSDDEVDAAEEPQPFDPGSCEPTPARCDADADGDERPGRLSEHSAVYDPQRLEMIVFGGTSTIPEACAFGGPVRFVDDTWIYDDVCKTWSRVKALGPSATGRHMAAFGSGDMWIFGGRFRDAELESGPYELYADLFRFHVADRSWHEVTVEGARPSPRVNGALIWDDERERLWLFGGNTSADGAIYAPQADLWSFDPQSGRWKEHDAEGPLPSPRLFVAGLYDALRDTLVIYGGADDGGFLQDAAYMGDVWELPLETLRWQRLHPGGAGAPAGRFWAGFVHELDRDSYLLFGGHDDRELGNRNDVWRFDPDELTWQRVSDGDEFNTPARDFCDFPPDFATVDLEAPERRNAHTLVYSEGCGHALVFGGKTDCGAIDDVWALDGNRWREGVDATEGEACLRWRDDPDTCRDMCF